MEIVKIDLVPSGVMPSCHASQYDIGREIRFLLTDGGEEYTLAGTETISIELRKPDGTSETIAIPNTSSNYVDWETSDGELDLSGVYLAEISIKNGDDVLGSANFIVKTEADAYDGADVRTITVGPADICTFETTLPEPLQSVIVDIEATGGYDADTQTAHPINGYTEANITNRTGLNLWNEHWELVNGRVTSKNYIRVKPSTRYFFYNINLYDITMYDSAYTNLGHPSYGSRPNGFVFQTSANCEWIKFNLGSPYGSTYNHDVSINYPETDMEYHPYNGQTYTIAFGQTVYGGVLDVTRGKLSVTWGDVDLGDLNWTYRGPDFPNVFATTDVSDYKTPTLNALCSAYSYGGIVASIANVTEDKTFYFYYMPNSPSRYLYIKDTAYTDKTTFTTAVTGKKLAYELATPFDIDITPEVISAAVGTNNVFADCGQTTVKYLKAGA